MKSASQNIDFVGKDPATKDLMKRLSQFAPTDLPVLLLGETGVGKEVAARSIHQFSRRPTKPLIPINCAALPESLAESELFGHERGAFTGAVSSRPGAFEMAHQGTLFLDEFGELPLSIQAKLLRVLETGEVRRLGSDRFRKVNVRLVAASNRNLIQESQRGSFRQDLYFRVAVCVVHIEPLRRRTKDIPLLAALFLSQIEDCIGHRTLTEDAIKKLEQYAWPGNIRELRNVVFRAAIQAKGTVIDAKLIELETGFFANTENGFGLFSESRSLRDIEREAIRLELERNGWNRRKTARVMGIALSTVKDKIRRYGLKPAEFDTR